MLFLRSLTLLGESKGRETGRVSGSVAKERRRAKHAGMLGDQMLSVAHDAVFIKLIIDRTLQIPLSSPPIVNKLRSLCLEPAHLHN